MSKVTPQEFSENIKSIYELEENIYNNPWLNSLVDNTLTDKKINNNINMRKAFYYNKEGDKYDNTIFVLKTIYFIVVFVLIIKIIIVGQDSIQPPMIGLIVFLFIFPFIIEYIKYGYDYISKNAKDSRPKNLHSVLD